MIPRVGVASVIAEGFLVLPFSRRDKQHTGHHPSVPPTLVATGLLHERRFGARRQQLAGRPSLTGDDAAPRLPEQVRVRLAKLKTLQRQRH